jgi:hypothetical protein
MQKSDLYEESKADIVIGVVLAVLFVLVVVAQSGTSLNTQSVISDLFFH